MYAISLVCVRTQKLLNIIKTLYSLLVDRWTGHPQDITYEKHRRKTQSYYNFCTE